DARRVAVCMDHLRQMLDSSVSARLVPLQLRFICSWFIYLALMFFFFSSRRRHTRSVSAFLLNRSSDLHSLPTVNTTGYIDHAAFLGTINPDTNKIPKHLFQGYLNIYNNYFKAPWMPDRTEANPNEL